MRLYLDQMFRSYLAEQLRSAGHDVLTSEEAGQDCADDAEVMSRSVSEGRVLVTLDEHFGDWNVLPLGRHPGVIRLKTNPSTTANAAALLLPLLENLDPDDVANHLLILSRGRVRWIRTG